MKTTKQTILFPLLILLANLLVGSIHYLGLSDEPTVLDVKLTYAINAIATILVCLSIKTIQEVFPTQIGFIFLGFSTLKMIVFYMALNPQGANGHTATIDALLFFIPYFLNLILEVIWLLKLLNAKG